MVRRREDGDRASREPTDPPDRVNSSVEAVESPALQSPAVAPARPRAPRSAGVCHSFSAFKNNSDALAPSISTAASASAEWAWRERPAFGEKAGNGLREISELPSWARHQPSATTGACRAQRIRTAGFLTLPLNRGGVGCVRTRAAARSQSAIPTLRTSAVQPRHVSVANQSRAKTGSSTFSELAS